MKINKLEIVYLSPYYLWLIANFSVNIRVEYWSLNESAIVWTCESNSITKTLWIQSTAIDSFLPLFINVIERNNMLTNKLYVVFNLIV